MFCVVYLFVLKLRCYYVGCYALLLDISIRLYVALSEILSATAGRWSAWLRRMPRRPNGGLRASALSVRGPTAG